MRRGCVSTVAVRVAEHRRDGFRAIHRMAEQEGRRQAFAYEGIPARPRAGLCGEPISLGSRTRLACAKRGGCYGEYRLTKQDCFAVARFDDRVLVCAARPSKITAQTWTGGEETVWGYVPGGQAYDVPYRTLVPRGRDEVWVAGRCFSATHDAHASCRSMAQTMAMGQAVGTAAALSLAGNWGAREVPISRLQERLRAGGAMLETPAQPAATGRDEWSKNSPKG
jgi:hypothetical protein